MMEKNLIKNTHTRHWVWCTLLYARNQPNTANFNLKKAGQSEEKSEGEVGQSTVLNRLGLIGKVRHQQRFYLFIYLWAKTYLLNFVNVNVFWPSGFTSRNQHYKSTLICALNVYIKVFTAAVCSIKWSKIN